MNNATFDFIIVGAGPAGLACAKTFIDQKNDFKILIIDKENFPRDKVCGDALTYHSLPLIKKIFPELNDILPSKSFTKNFCCYYENGSHILNKESVLDVIPRKELDNLMMNTIRGKNITIFENGHVKDIITDNQKVIGLQCKINDQMISYYAKWILGADGANSIIRRKTGTTLNDHKIGAIRQYVRNIPSKLDNLSFYIDTKNKGYFWIFPFIKNNEQWANIGCGSFINTNNNPKVQYKEFLQKGEIQSILGACEFIDKPKGFPINLASTRLNRIYLPRSIASEGYMLLGDASCIVNPFTGEGIAYALFSGEYAAKLLLKKTEAKEIILNFEKESLKFVNTCYALTSGALMFNIPCLLPKFLVSPFTNTTCFLDKHTNLIQ